VKFDSVKWKIFSLTNLLGDAVGLWICREELECCKVLGNMLRTKGLLVYKSALPSSRTGVIIYRSFSSGTTTTKESVMEEKVKQALQQNVTSIEVKDISGGCGSFFKVKVVSPTFVGKSPVERNRIIYSALKEEIAEMHGIDVECKAPNS
jgi:stress-induced morphogen